MSLSLLAFPMNQGIRLANLMYSPKLEWEEPPWTWWLSSGHPASGRWERSSKTGKAVEITFQFLRRRHPSGEGWWGHRNSPCSPLSIRTFSGWEFSWVKYTPLSLLGKNYFSLGCQRSPCHTLTVLLIFKSSHTNICQSMILCSFHVSCYETPPSVSRF